jgi:hypothetical protein
MRLKYRDTWVCDITYISFRLKMVEADPTDSEVDLVNLWRRVLDHIVEATPVSTPQKSVEIQAQRCIQATEIINPHRKYSDLPCLGPL